MTEPATDEEIARLEADVASGAMIFEIRNHEMERILARIKAEREQTIRECAEIVHAMGGRLDDMLERKRVISAILALLDKKS